MKTTTRLRQAILAPEILIIPGAPDALCARIAERCGFQAVFVSGYAASASLLAAPDIGLLSLTEMVDLAWRIADAVSIPVFADGDTGHGNATNAARTLRQLEKAGVAGVFFEDQLFPKRCGHMSGKQVIPPEEMIAKIKAAVDARRDPDLIIMARTDALALHGMEAAVARMHRYLEAGADMAFIEAPRTEQELRVAARAVNAPSMANMVPGGKTPLLPARQLEEMGFACVAYPTLLTYSLARTAARALRHLLREGGVTGWEDQMMSFDEFHRLVELDAYRAAEQRYLSGGSRG